MTTEDATYSGWTNYETWAVGLYLDGNYTGVGTYRDTIRTVRAALDLNHPTSEYWTADQSRLYAVADALKEWVRGAEGPSGSSLAADLLGAALDSVNWHELADNWIENLADMEAHSHA